MKILLKFMLILAISYNSLPLFAADKDDVEYEAKILVARPECLQYMGAGQGRGSSYQLKFYNTCPRHVYANVCVEERPGKFRLHRSASKIPKYGHLTLFSYEGMAPLSVQWISGSGRLGVPEPCK